ncbi:MAG: YgiT-type zinc finger protein [Blastocatellia bacterium]
MENKEVEKMMKSPCTECGGKVERKAITQEYEREGLRVKISGFKTWICKRCGEIYFSPEGAKQFTQAVNSLFALAGAEEQHKGLLIARMASGD